jgi:hypothetical protein
MTKSRRMILLGHATGMRKNRGAYRILMRKPETLGNLLVHGRIILK